MLASAAPRASLDALAASPLGDIEPSEMEFATALAVTATHDFALLGTDLRNGRVRLLLEHQGVICEVRQFEEIRQ